jgi:hypothetical protein
MQYPQQITFNGFCVLGGLKNPKLSTRREYLGKHYMFTTYWYNPLI